MAHKDEDFAKKKHIKGIWLGYLKKNWSKSHKQ
jgi:hypothetical protein